MSFCSLEPDRFPNGLRLGKDPSSPCTHDMRGCLSACGFFEVLSIGSTNWGFLPSSSIPAAPARNLTHLEDGGTHCPGSQFFSPLLGRDCLCSKLPCDHAPPKRLCLTPRWKRLKLWGVDPKTFIFSPLRSTPLSCFRGDGRNHKQMCPFPVLATG